MQNNFLDSLEKIVGSENIILDIQQREELSKDKCTKNLFEQKRPCAVVVKVSKDGYACSLLALIFLVRKYGQKIIVRGGGSGVCGALVPQKPLNTVMVDITSLNEIFEINRNQGFVVCGAGILGLQLEESVNEHDYTLGHSPASLAISTPGGWIATRSSGQFSSRYGTVEELVLGIEVFTGDGRALWTEKTDDLKNFFRMEGTNGIITKVKMKIFPRSRCKRFMTISLPNTKTALRIMEKLSLFRSDLEERKVFLSSLRLYDWLDFKIISKPHKKETGNKNKAKFFFEKAMLRHPQIVNFLAKFLKKSTMILMLESNEEVGLRFACRQIRNICWEKGTNKWWREENEEWSKNWYENRFKLGHDKVVEHAKEGIIVDTFDCSGNFEKLPTIYQKVKKSVANLAILGAHFGMDRNTPYIYFTFAAISRNEENKSDLHNKIWRKILDACRQNGGLTTHHHGIGLLKAGLDNSLVPFAYGHNWLEEAQKAKNKFDPDNTFNPSKII